MTATCMEVQQGDFFIVNSIVIALDGIISLSLSRFSDVTEHIPYNSVDILNNTPFIV
jgi:hypothetical protein